MNAAWQARIVLVLLLSVGAAVFCVGITWGLPDRDVDRYLFGEREPWNGQQILELAGGREYDPTLGADVDRTPLAERDQVIWLNETDEQRAQILIRYRLYTYQPDEMITMMSLASMRPGQGDFDPKLYQYGGLWIYAVGALLKLASLAGFVHLTPDLVHYLDHPEDFGRFYVVARLHVVAWALVGVWAMFWVTRRLTGGSIGAAAAAAACFIAMPVVVNMAHEAKPHLPGAVLMLLAVAAAMRYAETGARRWWITAAALCGAAFGMVLSALPIFVILPVMTLLRPQTWGERALIMLGGGAVGAGLYILTNPYMLINQFTAAGRAVLRSNLDNSLAMYEIGRWSEGLVNAAALVAEGASPLLAGAGVVGTVVLAIRWLRATAREVGQPKPREGSPPALGARKDSRTSGSGSRLPDAACRPENLPVLLAAPALLILLQFVALAAGKPGEYGRFAVFPDMALAIAAIGFVYSHASTSGMYKHVLPAALVLATAVSGSSYLFAVTRDAGPSSTRHAAADQLARFHAQGAGRIGLLAEPAPYVQPPIDLFAWQILLLPEGGPARGETGDADLVIAARGSKQTLPEETPPGYIRVRGGPRLDPTPISWASKNFEFWIRRQVK